MIFALVAAQILPRLIGKTPVLDPLGSIYRVAVIAPAVWAAFVLMFYALTRLFAVTVVADGIFGSSSLGFKRFLRWNEIEQVSPYSIYGLRMLRLECANHAQAAVPMWFDDLSALKRYVVMHAGPDHPLSRWLISQ